MSVMRSTPPPSRTVATADDTLLSRSSARNAPTSGPSNSTSRRSAHTVRTMVALPDACGPGYQYSEIGCGAELFEELGLVECQLEPFGEAAGLRVCALEVVEAHGRFAGRGDGVLTGSGQRRRRESSSDVAIEATPDAQLTDEFGCTLTVPAGSTPVTVSNSDVQVMPTEDASAEVAADVGMSGPSSRGSSDTVSPTVITLPSSA